MVEIHVLYRNWSHCLSIVPPAAQSTSQDMRIRSNSYPSVVFSASDSIPIPNVVSGYALLSTIITILQRRVRVRPVTEWRARSLVATVSVSAGTAQVLVVTVGMTGHKAYRVSVKVWEKQVRLNHRENPEPVYRNSNVYLARSVPSTSRLPLE